MVLVVSSVQVHVIGIDEQEPKQDEQDLQGVPASIHKVSVEHIRLLRRRQPVLAVLITLIQMDLPDSGDVEC